MVTDIHHTTLDKTRPGERQEARERAEKLPKPCSKCGAVHTGNTCPSCGHERKPFANVETRDGDLVELRGKRAAPTMADKQRFWSMALHLDRERNRGGKLAKGLYKGKFGVWPRGLDDRPAPPDAAFMSYERSRRIAYAKRKAAECGVMA